MQSNNPLRPMVGEEADASKHLRRLVTLLVLAIPAFFLVRSGFVPDSFGRDGHYRATAVDDIVSQEPAYVTSFSCSECHEERVAEAEEGGHGAIQCETCHGPAIGHLTTDDETRLKLIVPEAPAVCLGCHETAVGRPEDFPQITVEQHAKKNEFEIGEACDECHEPHDP